MAPLLQKYVPSTHPGPSTNYSCDITCAYTYWIILHLTLIPNWNVPISINLNIKIWSLCKSTASVWSIVQITIWLTIKQILYSFLKLSSCITQLFTCISIHTKINILKICWISKETLMHNSNTIISHCICHSIVKILYIGNGKRGIIQRRTCNWRTKMHNTMYYHYAHWTVCMFVYFIACYYELLMLIYMNCSMNICCDCMNINDCEWALDKDKCNLFWQANKSILVLCSSTERTCFQSY